MPYSDTIQNIICATNFIASTSLLYLFVYYVYYHKLKGLKVLPKSLRWFILTCTVPFCIIEAIGSMYFSSHIILNHEYNSLYYRIPRFIISTSAQLVRGSFFTILIERIISTIFLEKYSNCSSGMSSFICMTVFVYATTILHMASDFMWLFIPNLHFIYYNVVYVEISIHVLIILICKVLHLINREMYSSLAYRVSLTRRYQILENIKVLKFLWPILLIFAAISPIGFILTLLHNYIKQSVAPICFYLITYHISFILILLYRIRCNSRNKVSNGIFQSGKRIMPIISPLGQSLPIYATSESYFNNLHQQWNQN